METNMSNYTLIFDDLEVHTMAGVCLASGSVKVEYRVNPAEPDVGIMSRWVEITGYCDIDAVFVLTDEEGEEIMRMVCNDAMLADILDAYGEENIVDEIAERI